MCVKIDSITPVDSSDVDAFQNTDCNGDGTTDDPEPFTKHDASVSFSAILLEGATSPPAPGFVTLTGYTVDYTPNPSNPVAAPALSSWSLGLTQGIDVDTSVTLPLEMVPVSTKLEYAVGGSQVPAIYTATYTIMGTTQFNEDIVLQGVASFNIGEFDTCE
jgi:hypothetical protein